MFCNISWKNLIELLASPIKLRSIRLLQVFIITQMDELTLWESRMNLQGTPHDKASFRAALTVWSRLVCGHACVSINTWKRWWSHGHPWHPLEPCGGDVGNGSEGDNHIYTVCSVLGAAVSIYLLDSRKKSLSYIFKSSLFYKWGNWGPERWSPLAQVHRKWSGACETKAALFSEPKLGYNCNAGHRARCKTNESACLCVCEHTFVYITRASKYWKKYVFCFFFSLHSLSHCLQAFFFFWLLFYYSRGGLGAGRQLIIRLFKHCPSKFFAGS